MSELREFFGRTGSVFHNLCSALDNKMHFWSPYYRYIRKIALKASYLWILATFYVIFFPQKCSSYYNE